MYIIYLNKEKLNNCVQKGGVNFLGFTFQVNLCSHALKDCSLSMKNNHSASNPETISKISKILFTKSDPPQSTEVNIILHPEVLTQSITFHNQ
jgi:hypothetical protein